MANLNRDQVKQIIAKAPAGVSGEDVVNQLVASGHTLEGYTPAQPRQAADSGEALLTDLPTQGFKQDLVRGLPATAYGLIGGVLGAPLGPLGIAAGAGLGGLVGESLRQGVTHATAAAFPEQNYPSQDVRGTASSIIGQGVSQGAGAGIAQGIGAGLGFIRPGINTVGAAVMKVAAGIPEDVGQAVMKNPSLLLNTPTREAVNAAYNSFHEASGTTSRKDFVHASEDPFDSVARARADMVTAHNNLRSGTITPQEAVNSSQAGRVISDMKSRGNEMAQEIGSQASEQKAKADTWLASQKFNNQDTVDLWQKARTLSYRENIGNEFGSPFPQNISGQANVLRPWAALGSGAGVGAAAAGPVGAAVGGAGAVALTSPLTYRTALQGAALIGKIPTPIYRVVGQAVSGAEGSSLSDHYLRQNRIPVPDPSMQSIGGMMPARPSY